MPRRGHADPRDVVDRCAQCLTPLSGRVVYRAPDGETLCADCHFALWGLRNGKRPRRVQRLAAPRHRRRRRTAWVREATDELGIEERVQRVLRSQRPTS